MCQGEEEERMGTTDAKEEAPTGLGDWSDLGQEAMDQRTKQSKTKKAFFFKLVLFLKLHVINMDDWNDGQPWGKMMNLVLYDAIFEMAHTVICLMIGFM